MDTALAASIRSQLLDRRDRLQRAVAGISPADDLLRLLHDVDGALERMEAGRFGMCEVCHTPVLDDDLVAHPLTPYCLCELSSAQQDALQRDLNLARRVQMSLLPRQDLATGGWQVHFRYWPAGPVSGDYLDVVSRNGRASDSYFLLGDVSGKGLAASLLMARLSALLRSLIESGPPLAELVTRANRLFSENELSSHFATLVCARATPAGRVEVCNAGHCPPLVARGGDVQQVDSGGMPVGIASDGAYETQSLSLAPGDTLLFYSDGVSEAMNPEHEQFGVERLIDCVRRHAPQPPVGLAAAILRDVSSFRAGAPPHDDVSLMIVRRMA